MWSTIRLTETGVALTARKNASGITMADLPSSTAHVLTQFGGYPNGDYYLAGIEVADVLIYDSALSTTDRDTVESYLNTRYAIY